MVVMMVLVVMVVLKVVVVVVLFLFIIFNERGVRVRRDVIWKPRPRPGWLESSSLNANLHIIVSMHQQSEVPWSLLFSIAQSELLRAGHAARGPASNQDLRRRASTPARLPGLGWPVFNAHYPTFFCS